MALQSAAQKGMDEFLKVFYDAYQQALEGGLSASNMQMLTVEQHTLYAYMILRDELMEGGFCQLIQNGWGGYILHNPVAKVLKSWGLTELGKILYKAREIYDAHREDLEMDRSDDEFMAMYERYEVFDPLEEYFIEEEEQLTGMVACYVDDHIDLFAEVI